MRALIGLASAAALVLSGCAYESPVPLGQVDAAPFDEALLGEWVAGGSGEEAGDSLRLTVIRFDGPQYYVELESTEREPAPGGSRLVKIERERYRGYLTEVGSARFMNLQDLEDEDRHYEFARYQVDAQGTLTVRFLRHEMVKPPLASSEALRAFVESRVEDPGIYEAESPQVRLVRPRPEPPGAPAERVPGGNVIWYPSLPSRYLIVVFAVRSNTCSLPDPAASVGPAASAPVWPAPPGRSSPRGSCALVHRSGNPFGRSRDLPDVDAEPADGGRRPVDGELAHALGAEREWEWSYGVSSITTSMRGAHRALGQPGGEPAGGASVPERGRSAGLSR